jgi:hypothetical protein
MDRETEWIESLERRRTMESVATISFGGEMLEATICETKFAVMPTMASMEIIERTRKRTKVLARGAAPCEGTGIIVAVVEVLRDSDVDLCTAVVIPASGWLVVIYYRAD